MIEDNERLSPSGAGWSETASRFFQEPPGALRDHLNIDELVRVVTVAVTAGGGLYGLLELLVVYAGTIFPAPADAGLAAAVLTLILESRRRLRQGATPPDPPTGRRRLPGRGRD
jgi:hypothetical protein